MDSSHNGYIGFDEYVQFYKYTWFYNNIRKNAKGLVEDKSIKDTLSNFLSPIMFYTLDKIKVEKFCDFLGVSG